MELAMPAGTITEALIAINAGADANATDNAENTENK